MGAYKTYNVSTSNQNINGYVTISEGDYSIANNTSPVYVSLYLHRSNIYSGTTASYSSNFYINIDGNSYQIVNNGYVEIPPSSSSGGGAYVHIGSASKTISHNSDGTKSINVSVSGTMPYAGSGITLSNQGTSIGLTTIPRASGVSCSSPYIGDTATITIDRKSTSFTNTVSYSISNITGVVATKTSNTVLSLNTSSLKEQIYSLIPNSKRISGTIYCTTYSGNTQIGNTQSTTFNLYARDDECLPDISASIIDTNEKTIELTGNNSIIVKNASKPKVSVTAVSKYSSTISSYLINLNDGQTSNQQEYIFESINSNSVLVSTTDSRGYSKSATIDVSDKVIEYIKIHFNSIELLRPEGTSNEVILNCDGNFYNGDFKESLENQLTCKFMYKKSEDEEWIDGGIITPTITNNSFVFNRFSLGNTYDYESEYQFKIIASDLLTSAGDESANIITVPRGEAVVEIGDELVNVNGLLTVKDKELWQLIYPIGKIYLSTDSTSPQILFGGTWEQINGYYLYAGAGGTISGSNTSGEPSTNTTGSTSLTIGQLPSHNHYLSNSQSFGSGTTAGWRAIKSSDSSEYDYASTTYTSSTGSGEGHTHTLSSHTHTVNPLRYELYAWRRIA